MWRPGDVVAGRFSIEGIAGSGGMATVWRARDRRTGEQVALKTFRAGEPRQIERFVREAQILATLAHPAIVRYVAHGIEGGGACYLAMEWLEGERLSDRLEQGKMEVRDALALGQRAAEALGAAHERGVIHRDVKPSNLILAGGRAGRPTLIDFGIAKPWAQASEVTQTGVMIGTPGYMAPEQARGSTALAPSADVFALGCLLYKCISGRAPFQGEDPISVLLKVVLGDPPRLRELRPDIPESVDALVARMMSKRPEDRPADGAAAAAELRALREAEGPVRAVEISSAATISAREIRVVSLALAASARSAEARPAPTSTWTLVLPSADVVAATIATLGCRMEILADGSIAALPQEGSAATDLALRAARAALALRKLLPAGTPIAVVTGRGDAASPSPVGEVIDRAAALLRTAAGGRVAVDDATLRLLGMRFEAIHDDRGASLLREHEDVDASRHLLGHATPLVGRERDLNALLALFDECAEDASARAMLLVAEAGAGKSRLCHQFLATIHELRPGACTLVGHADPMRSDVPFSLLGSALANGAGIRAEDGAEVRRTKIADRLCLRVPAPRRHSLAAFLGEMVGAPFPDGDDAQLRAARADPTLMGDQLLRAVCDLFTEACAHGPVILVLDDLHWSDRPSVRFLDALLRRLNDQPFMVIASARPQVIAAFPDLWHGRGLVRRELRPLAAAACRKLVRDVLGDRAPAEAVERIVDRAAGNALYLEELIRAEAEGRTGAVPESVLAMVQARLRALPVETRRVLRAASVFGQSFCEAGARALLGKEHGITPVEELLTELVVREVIEPQPADEQRRGRAFRFRHDLAREAAYQMLTDADRALGHLLAARWLEQDDAPDAAVIADHFERGGEPGSAVRWLVRAAALALEASDLTSVHACAERAVAAGAMGEELGALRLLEAEAHGSQSRNEAMERCAADALALLPPGSPRWCDALVQASIAAGRLGRPERGIELADALRPWLSGPSIPREALLAAAQLANHLAISRFDEPAAAMLERIDGALSAGPAGDDAVLLARVHLARGQLALRMGRPGPAMGDYSAAAAILESVGNLRLACRALLAAAAAHKMIGDNERAEATYRKALAWAEQHMAPTWATDAKHNLTLLLVRRGAFEEAVALGNEAAATYAEGRNRRMERATRLYVALALEGAGRLDDAEEQALAAAEPPPAELGLAAHALAVLARVRLSRGRIADALASAEEAGRKMDAAGRVEEGESFVRLVLAECRAAAGQSAGARAALEAAREAVERQAASIGDEQARALFLRSVPENAKILALLGAESTRPAG